MKGYPTRFLVALIGTVLAAWISGMLLAPTTLALRADLSVPWRLASGARLGVAALHGAAAFALLFLCGALWSVHMRAGWRRHRQRASGVAMTGLQLVLALTGLAIYYAGEERLANAAALAHVGAGVLLIVPLAWHWVRARTGRRLGHHRHAGAATRRLASRSR